MELLYKLTEKKVLNFKVMFPQAQIASLNNLDQLIKASLLKADSMQSFSFPESLFFNYFSILKTCTITYSFLYEITENVL